MVDEINARMPTEEEFKEFDISAKLSHLSEVGDQSTLAMQLRSFNSIRDNADFLSLDDEVIDKCGLDEVMKRVNDACLLG